MTRYFHEKQSLIAFYLAASASVIGMVIMLYKFQAEFSTLVTLCHQYTTTFFLQPQNLPHLSLITVIITLFSIGLIRAIFFLIRESINTIRLERSLKTSEKISCHGENLFMVKDSRFFAFTYGLFQPRILISSALKQRMDNDQLSALIEHERHHQAKRHPLFIFTIELLFQMLFFIPLLFHLRRFVHLKCEIDADSAAIRNTSKKSLAAAMFSMVNQDSFQAPISAAHFSSLKSRVDFIVGDKKPKFKLKPHHLVTYMAGMVWLVACIFTPSIDHQALAAQAVNDQLFESTDCYCKMQLPPAS